MKASDILNSYYRKKRKDGKRFSMRAMAKKLGVSVSLLSLILKGKRNLPIRLVDPLCQLLDIDNVDRDDILRQVLTKSGAEIDRALDLISFSEKKRPSLKKLQWETIAKSESEFIADWTDIAIFLCTALKDFDGTPEFVSRRLFLDLGLVNKKMIRLAESGFLKNVDGKMVKAKKTLQVKSAKDLSLIRKYHKAHLENAIWALDQNTEPKDLQNRLITGMSVTVSKRSIAALKQKIQSFLVEVAELCSEEDPDEVFQLGIQFFPLSKIK